jgi:hypothetical protein
VVGQIFRRREHPLKPLPAGGRSRFASPIPWGDLFIPSALVQSPDSLFDLRIADYQEAPALPVAAARAQTPASTILRINSFGTGLASAVASIGWYG